jgi:hypothetical protein
MKEKETGSSNLHLRLAEILVPKEILENFEIKGLIERKTEIEIELIEKEDRIPEPLKNKEIVLNGFMNPITLQHYPITGKRCYLKLIRRRWKEKGDEPGKTSNHNTYDYTAEGTKATRSFGGFLKDYL